MPEPPRPKLDRARSRWLPVDRRLLRHGPHLGAAGIAVSVALGEIALHPDDRPAESLPLDAIADLTGLEAAHVADCLAALVAIGAAERTDEDGRASWRPRPVPAAPPVPARPDRRYH